MYCLLGAFAYSSALTYHVQDITRLVSAGKFSVSTGILLWGALVWFIAFHSRFRPMLALDALTAVWLIFLIRNITSPHSLLYSDIVQVEQTLPTGEVLSLMHSSLSPWWAAMGIAILASLLFSVYSLYKLYKADRRKHFEALTLGGGLFLLALVTVSDNLVITGTLEGVYLAPFGFLFFLLSGSLYPVLHDFYRRRRAPVIYNLTYNPEKASFHSDVSQLKTPLSEQLNMEAPGSYGWQDSETSEYTFGSVTKKTKTGETAPAKATESETPAATVRPVKPSQPETDRRPPLDQSTLHIISDNLIDIAVYATMAMNRFKRGDADPKVLEKLCKQVRAKSIKTRRLVNQYTDDEKPKGNRTD